MSSEKRNRTQRHRREHLSAPFRFDRTYRNITHSRPQPLLNNTRKRWTPPDEPAPKVERNPPFWDRFLVEGKELFDYMTNHYEAMLTEDSIPHLIVRPGYYPNDIEDMQTEFESLYWDEMESELLKWIGAERAEGRLLEESAWKPFRDLHHHMCMTMGYRKMFRFGKYCFLLALEEDCEMGCRTCLREEEGEGDCCRYSHRGPRQALSLAQSPSPQPLVGRRGPIHFLLLFYGFIDSEGIIQPFGKYTIKGDNMLPEGFWKWK